MNLSLCTASFAGMAALVNLAGCRAEVTTPNEASSDAIIHSMDECISFAMHRRSFRTISPQLNLEDQQSYRDYNASVLAETLHTLCNIQDACAYARAVASMDIYECGFRSIGLEQRQRDKFLIRISYDLDTEGIFDSLERRHVMEQAAMLWEKNITSEFEDIKAGSTLYVYNPSIIEFAQTQSDSEIAEINEELASALI